MFLEISQNSQENTCARASFLIKLACNFLKKEALAQVFSCEFREISKNTFFIEHLWATASNEVSGSRAYCLLRWPENWKKQNLVLVYLEKKTVHTEIKNKMYLYKSINLSKTWHWQKLPGIKKIGLL